MIKRNSNQSAIMLCLLLVIIQQSIQALPRPSFSMPTFATSKKMATKLGKITAALVAIGLFGDQSFQRTKAFKTKAKELIDSENPGEFNTWVINRFVDLTTDKKMHTFPAKDKKNGAFFKPTTNIKVSRSETGGYTAELNTSGASATNSAYNGKVFASYRKEYSNNNPHDNLILTIIHNPSFYKDLVNHADEYIIIFDNVNSSGDDHQRFIDHKTNTGFNNDGKRAHIIAQDMKKYATDNPSISDYIPLFIQENPRYNSVWFRWKVFKSLLHQRKYIS